MSDWKARSQILGDVVFFRYGAAELEKSFSEVYVWDLDKTYLDTRWGSPRELIRTALEKAFQKRNIPGTSSLVSALKTSWEQERGSIKAFPIYFITASPPQMETRVREKLEYIYAVPASWSDSTGPAPAALLELAADLRLLLLELTGSVVIRHLARIPELRDGQIMFLTKEEQP